MVNKRMTIHDAQKAQDSHAKCDKEIKEILRKYMNDAYKAIMDKMIEGGYLKEIK